MKIESVHRYDNIDNSDFLIRPFERTPDGFLSGRAVVTSIGVFSYLKADGTVQKELRLPEEVFNPDTLNSMKLKPMTLTHPTENGGLVSPENVQSLQVGSLGDNPTGGRFGFEEVEGDNINCAIDLSITRADAINAVESGMNGLSMGYTCDLEKAVEGATWCGVEYDFIQRNIRYNHCAIVNRGRAGDNAKIVLRVDSADAILENTLTNGIHDKTINRRNPMKKISLDGIDYEADEKVIAVLKRTEKRADEAEEEAEQKTSELDKLRAEFEEMKKSFEEKLSALTAEKDEAEETAEKAKEEAEQAKADSADPKKLNELVNARMNLVSTAQKAGVEVKGDEADMEIKKAIVAKVYPRANLDGKDDIYINARFDGAVEMLSDSQDANNRAMLNAPTVTHGDAMDARARMIERLKKGNKED